MEAAATDGVAVMAAVGAVMRAPIRRGRDYFNIW
jgi:hypothetical protein